MLKYHADEFQTPKVHFPSGLSAIVKNGACFPQILAPRIRHSFTSIQP